MSILQRLKNRDLEEKKAVLLAKLEEAELGERAALGEASRVREDNEGLKVSHRVGIAMMGFLQEKREKVLKMLLYAASPQVLTLTKDWPYLNYSHVKVMLKT